MSLFSRKPKLLEPGTPAPDFTVKDHKGATVKLSALRGKRVLMWFYPKASTSGCTKEGQGFCARAPQLQPDMVILGVSFDEQAANRKFAEEHRFPFQLLCDTDKAIAIAYGAAKDKGASYPDRVTYVIDKDGKVEWAEKVTDIDAHIHSAMAHLSDA